MKKRPHHQGHERAKDQNEVNTHRKFTGTNNPRHLRVLQVLLSRPLTREQLDKVAGCSNGPDVVNNLRRRGLGIPCERIYFKDRDGKACRPGVYSLLASDRKLIYRWMVDRGRAA